MWSALAELPRVLVAADYLYLPLRFDPDIAVAVSNAPIIPWSPSAAAPAALLLQHPDGEIFIRTLALPALAAAILELYPALVPEGEARPQPGSPLPDKLMVIVFEVLPYFVRLSSSGSGPEAKRQAILRRLAAAVPETTPVAALEARWREQARQWQNLLQELQETAPASAPLPPGCYSGAQVWEWLHREARVKAHHSLLAAYREAVTALDSWLALGSEEFRILLALEQPEQLEVDGFGWQKLPQPGEYLVYKRTGPYLLEDYFRRPYLFPDCRVAVPTTGPFRPLVLDRYKHPLLRSFRPRQPICLPEDYQPAVSFSAGAVIAALEAGLNALYYGYNPRQRNGYHSLDRFGRTFSDLDFEDLRLPPDHPLLAQLEVKNCYW